MKKIVLFCLLLMAAVGMQAQRLDGSWYYTVGEGEEKVDMYFIFNKGNVSLNVYCDVNDPTVGSVTLLVMVPGSYTHKGDNLNIKTFPEQCELKIEKMIFSEELVEAFKEQPELEQTVRDALYNSLSENKDKFTDGFMQFGDLNILKLTDRELWLNKEGDTDKVVLTRCTE